MHIAGMSAYYDSWLFHNIYQHYNLPQFEQFLKYKHVQYTNTNNFDQHKLTGKR